MRWRGASIWSHRRMVRSCARFPSRSGQKSIPNLIGKMQLCRTQPSPIRTPPVSSRITFSPVLLSSLLLLHGRDARLHLSAFFATLLPSAKGRIIRSTRATPPPVLWRQPFAPLVTVCRITMANVSAGFS